MSETIVKAELKDSECSFTPSNHNKSVNRRRAARACEGCRKQKVACNGKDPCTACMIRNRECVYTHLTVTGRPSKGSLKLLQRQVQELEAQLASAKAQIDQKSITQSMESEKPDSPMKTRSSFSPILSKQQDRCNDDAEESEENEENEEEYKEEVEFSFLHHPVKRVQDDSARLTLLGCEQRVLDLHTSSRLEKQEFGNYQTNKGLALMAMRLGQSMDITAHTTERIFSESGNLISSTEAETESFPVREVSSALLKELHWPSPEREEQLVSVYFCLIHPSFPFLCQNTLNQQRSAPFRDAFEHDPIWVSIMLGIFIAAGGHLQSEWPKLQLWWDARVLIGAHQLAYTASIGGVQDLLLTVLVRRRLYMTQHIEWIASGNAIRVLQDRGFHREAVLRVMDRDERYKDLLRCIWWTAQKLDASLFCYYGRTPIPYAFDILPPRGSSVVSPLSYFLASLKGIPFLLQTLHGRYGRDINVRSGVQQGVINWLNELREYFPFTPDGKDDEKTFACAKLWLFAHTTSILALRPALSSMLQILAVQKGKRTAEQMPSSQNDQDRKVEEYGEAIAKIKDGVHMTAIICKSLVDRSNFGITFWDDDVCVHSGFIVAVSAFLANVEALQGSICEDLIGCIETICSVTSEIKFDSPCQRRALTWINGLRTSLKSQVQRVVSSKSLRRYEEEKSAPLIKGAEPNLMTATMSSQGLTNNHGARKGVCRGESGSSTTPKCDEKGVKSPASKLWEELLQNEFLFFDGTEQHLLDGQTGIPMMVEPYAAPTELLHPAYQPFATSHAAQTNSAPSAAHDQLASASYVSPYFPQYYLGPDLRQIPLPVHPTQPDLSWGEGL